MLNGQTFTNQLFESHIFALFVNTFLDGYNGVATNYKNGMAVTYSGSNVSIDTGAICIQGRLLEEDAGTTLDAGTTTAYCKLVITLDLDLTNTQSTFNQGYYEIVTAQNDYPTLTQQDIVNTNSGTYQYELARFTTGSGGIANFVDKRTFLDIEGLYEDLQNTYAQDLGDLSDLDTTDKSSLVGAINEVNTAVSAILSAVYPVGSIYMSTTNTNPGTLFGGTWVAWGSGRVPVGVNTSDTNYNSVEKTGGSNTQSYTPGGTVGGHTLTINEIPSHTHKMADYAIWVQNVYGSVNVDGATGANRANISGATTQSTGGGQSHNHGFTGTATTLSHLQPYITCYMWKRTA